MQLSQSNYLQQRAAIDWSRMPAALTDKPKTVADNAAASGWAEMGEQTMKAVEQFFKLCNLLIAKDPTIVTMVAAAQQLPVETVKNSAPNVSKERRSRSATKTKPAPLAKSEPDITLPNSIPAPKVVPVIATHTAFIKRYLAMHGKVKTRDQIVSLVHGLQKAITEQRIRKDNPAMREIQKMQSELIAVVEKMDDRAKIEITEPYFSHYQQISQGEEVRASVKLLKQFIQLNGKAPDKAKAEKLGKKMAAAFGSIPKEDLYRGELSAGAKAIAAYVNGNTQTVGIPESTLHGLGELAGLGSATGLGHAHGCNAIITLLRNAHVKDLKDDSMRRAFSKATAPRMCLDLAKLMIRSGRLSMAVIQEHSARRPKSHRTELAGMDLDDEGQDEPGTSQTELLSMRLSHYGEVLPVSASFTQKSLQSTPQPIPTGSSNERSQSTEKVSARDLAKLRFNTIGYKGRFSDVVGDPAVGFHMMVYGKPFQGKSSFVIELCKDLAALGKGRIAYLALEEGISASMQKKVLDRGAANVDGLDFLSAMPTSFNGYCFVVIDSVSDRSLKREALRELFLQNSQTCFICIFHATKEGGARGGLDYSHDMDIIIRIEEHKPFVEKNRFL